MHKVAMYSTSKLFHNSVTGGLKRFLELYYELKYQGINIDLYCLDDPYTLKMNNIEGFSLKTTQESKIIFIPTELKIFFKNIGIIKKIKKEKYDMVIVFDVPTAIGLCFVGITNIQLFLRQDLIEYRKIMV